jgi:hypothetical protein
MMDAIEALDEVERRLLAESERATYMVRTDLLRIVREVRADVCMTEDPRNA